MVKKSSTEYIKNNDFLGALERFYEARKNWKEHWFLTCKEIYEVNPLLTELYIFNEEELTIVRLSKKTFYSKSKCVYLIKMFNSEANYSFLKCGKTKDLNKRLHDLSNHLYSRENVFILTNELIKTWELPTEHLAECCEQAFHDYLSKKYYHYRNDRYEPIELSESDFQELEKRYSIIINNFA